VGALKDHTAYMMAVLILTMLVIVLITQHYCVIDTSFALLPDITLSGAASFIYYHLLQLITLAWRYVVFPNLICLEL
jgi:hypothetical protein